MVQRQVGSSKFEFPCPSVLMKYQRDMGSIDRSDQMRMHGGGFSNHNHFKKWYKKVYLAVLDCMLINSFLAWNKSIEHNPTRCRLTRHDFMTYIAERMLHYRESNMMQVDMGTSLSTTPPRNRPVHRDEMHLPISSKAKTRCMVCRLETYWSKGLRQDKLTKNVATCSCCGVHAHVCIPIESQKRQIHKLDIFKNMSCFDIMHSRVGYEIWVRGREDASGMRRIYPRRDHDVMMQLKKHYKMGVTT
jgi:hypothetical protein